MVYTFTSYRGHSTLYLCDPDEGDLLDNEPLPNSENGHESDPDPVPDIVVIPPDTNN